MSNKPVIIAIDGTAASGKGTLSKKLANKFGYSYLDTGALYRRTAYEILKNEVDHADLHAVLAMAKSINYSQNTDIDLHTDAIGNIASKIAVYQSLRSFLNQLQIDFPVNKTGAVVDGRDIGTVIFPNADLKLFITASTEERAKRRYLQLSSKGLNTSYEVIFNDLKERDERDSRRLVAPTLAANDAVFIDTTDLNAEEVYNLAVSLTEKVIENAKKVA